MLRSSVSWVMRPSAGTMCVSKLTWSFGLAFFISSRIHCRASPSPFGAFGSASVLRVWKLASLVNSCWSRSSETAAISCWILASSSPVAGAWAAR
jgi:hypothetical protein